MVQNFTNMMNVLITYLHKYTTARRQQIARYQQPIAQIRQIRVQSQLPGIPIRLHHLRLTRHVRVVVVCHIPLAHERLEIRPEFHPVRRVDVDHLYLPTQPLEPQQRVHHHQ